MEPFERLLFIRKKLGESQETFAKNLGVQRGSYSDVERGKVKTFSESMLLLLRINYGINPDWVQYGTGDYFLPKTQAASPMSENETVDSLLLKLKEKDAKVEEQRKRIIELENLIGKLKQVIGE